MMPSKKEMNQNQSFYMAEPKNEEYIKRLVNGILDHRLREKSYYDMIRSKIEATAKYIIYKSGSDTIAIDGHTGKKVKKDTDAATVIQHALDNLTSGRTHKETVAFKGAFTITTTIDIPSYTILDLKGASLTLTDTAGFHMLQIGDGTTGVTDVDVIYGIFDGHRASQAELKSCIHVRDKCQRISVHNNYFTGWYGKGVFIDGGIGVNMCFYISICDNIMDDFEQGVDADGIDFDQVSFGTIRGNLIKETGDKAIEIGSGESITIIGNVIRDCVTGIRLRATKVVVKGNTISKIDEYGIVIESSQSTVVNGNYISSAFKHGIRMLGANYCTVNGNALWRSSYDTNNTYDDIILEDIDTDHCTHNVITGNTSLADSGNKVKYMIEEADANQNYNIIKNNINVGAVTGNVLTQGANSIASDNI